jgi:hypothetical protein
MTLGDPLSEFARSHIGSIEELRVFVVCVDHPQRWWSAAALAREVAQAVTNTQIALERLARRNLLDIRITDDVRYRFRPGTQDLEAQALAFAAAFRQDPVTVIQFVSRRTRRDSLRDFADAFRIRKHDDR